MQKKMPIGVDDFKKLSDEGYYFVDKTDFIRQLLDNRSQVTLITRPRRFGKTLAMSMLDWFFSIEKEAESRELFSQLAIAGAGEKYLRQRGQYPVLFISLKDIKAASWDAMLETFRSAISTWYLAFESIGHSGRVQKELRNRFKALLERRAGQSEMAVSLSLLMAVLKQYYGRAVVLLLDEYDAPIQQAWEGGFYREGIAFMKQFLGSALKGNPNLDFAVLTGVLRVAKESIFSDLNNLDVCSVLRDKYSDVFGFTPKEIKQMAKDLDLQGHLPEMKSWYDGYHIGNSELYNPWSVVNYVGNQCQARPYWVRTSGNSILRFLLSHADMLRVKMVRGLLENQAVRATLDESVIYPEIGRDQSALFTMLLTTGYLTVEKTISASDDRYALRIPNQEIRRLYRTEILNTLAAGVQKSTFDDLFDFLMDGETENFAYRLQEIIRSVVSTYDAANKETFYHGFMLGMTALFLGSQYTVESNRESGYGRFDLAIFPRTEGKAGVIMEFKAASSEKELEAKAREALEQIRTKRYDSAFAQRQVKTIWLYGIAFCGKKVAVVRG